MCFLFSTVFSVWVFFLFPVQYSTVQYSTVQYSTVQHNISTTKNFSIHGISRLVVLTKKNLNFKLLDDKTIWIKIPRAGMKSFLLCAVYHEHKLLNIQGTNTTGLLQMERWEKTLNQWAYIQAGVEVMMAGDMTMDYLRWDTPDQEHRLLVEKTKDTIETKGFMQMVTGPTRFWANTRPSLIDQIWSNQPVK